MLIQMLKNAFKPGQERTRTILRKGTVVDVLEEAARELIEKGAAAEVHKKAKAEPKSEEKTEEKPTRRTKAE